MIVLSRLSNFGRLIPLPFRGETGILLLRRSLADPTSRIRIVVLSTMVENAASTVVTAWIKLRTSLLSPLTRPRIPRLTENETEFRRYTLFLFRTPWKNVKFYTERRNSLTFSLSRACCFIAVKILAEAIRRIKNSYYCCQRKRRGELLLLSSCIFSVVVILSCKRVSFEREELLKLWNELRLTRFLSG